MRRQAVVDPLNLKEIDIDTFKQLFLAIDNYRIFQITDEAIKLYNKYNNEIINIRKERFIESLFSLENMDEPINVKAQFESDSDEGEDNDFGKRRYFNEAIGGGAKDDMHGVANNELKAPVKKAVNFMDLDEEEISLRYIELKNKVENVKNDMPNSATYAVLYDDMNPEVAMQPKSMGAYNVMLPKNPYEGNNNINPPPLYPGNRNTLVKKKVPGIIYNDSQPDMHEKEKNPKSLMIVGEKVKPMTHILHKASDVNLNDFDIKEQERLLLDFQRKKELQNQEMILDEAGNRRKQTVTYTKNSMIAPFRKRRQSIKKPEIDEKIIIEEQNKLTKTENKVLNESKNIQPKVEDPKFKAPKPILKNKKEKKEKEEVKPAPSNNNNNYQSQYDSDNESKIKFLNYMNDSASNFQSEDQYGGDQQPDVKVANMTQQNSGFNIYVNIDGITDKGKCLAHQNNLGLFKSPMLGNMMQNKLLDKQMPSLQLNSKLNNEEEKKQVNQVLQKPKIEVQESVEVKLEDRPPANKGGFNFDDLDDMGDMMFDGLGNKNTINFILFTNDFLHILNQIL
jgi:hypothetical protein